MTLGGFGNIWEEIHETHYIFIGDIDNFLNLKYRIIINAPKKTDAFPYWISLSICFWAVSSGKIHWFLFIALLVILLLNLLIAMMGWGWQWWWHQWRFTMMKTMVMMIPIKITIMMMKFIGHGKYLELMTFINRDTKSMIIINRDTYAKIAEIKNEWMRQWAR